MSKAKAKEQKPKGRPPLWDVYSNAIDTAAEEIGIENSLMVAGIALVDLRITFSVPDADLEAVPDDIWNNYIDQGIDFLVSKKREVQP